MICHSSRRSRLGPNRSCPLRHGVVPVLLLALLALPADARPPSEAIADSDLSSQSGPKKHQKRQKRPIKMGTSGGNTGDFTLDGPFIICCSGKAPPSVSLTKW